MYKLLLCWRYLRTRYLALACVVSVMLGVATLIIVNSVMGGFSTKLQEKLHQLLSDVLVESMSMDGFADPAGKMALVRRHPFLREQVVAMSPTLEVFALLQFHYPNGVPVTRPVRLIGIDPRSRGQIGGFRDHLVFPDQRKEVSFDVTGDALRRYELHNHNWAPPRPAPLPPLDPDEPPPPAPPPEVVLPPQGVILGNLIACYRDKNDDDDARGYKDVCLLFPGDTVVLTTVSSVRMEPVKRRFVVVGYFKSEMSEYDQNYVFVQLDYLQHLRTMQDRVTSIQMKLKDYGRAKEVVAALRRLFPESAGFRVETWEDKQGALLAAISIEKGILNVLLFLIIAVAGFGILAIFSMIVAEKTRDIGVLKALGASNGGVLKIFLGYGLLLGVLGAGLGSLLGLELTIHINDVEQWLGRVTGQDIFNRKIYYFDSIPTDIQPWNVVLVNLGAVATAVLFSVLPALRAALLHPVRALRYE
jgi:lipoprotein-releasing system permease protein